jgi:peptidoglycan/xylan/chitin deacetylase (PgdA/CDA1 family)
VARGVTLAERDIGGYTEERLRELVSTLAAAVYRAPIPPKIDSRTGGVVPGLAGREVDIAATLALCLAANPNQAVGFAWRLLLPAPPARDRPIFHGNEAKRQIAFVVNVAWGNEELLEILDLFARYNLTKTFFIVGRWADKFPELVREIERRGHEFGNHAYSDPHLPKLRDEEIRQEIRRTTAAIRRAAGNVPVPFFSPPYNDFNERIVRLAAELGYITVLCSVDTADWMRPGVERIVKRVLGKAHNGAIVLMHPTEQTPAALAELIPALFSQGYALVPLSTLLSAVPTEDVWEARP